MSLQIISIGNSGGCQGLDLSDLGASCTSCAPKLALSYEEEAILGRMRSLKNEVRPLAARLKYLEAEISRENGYRLSILRRESTDLTQQLEDLRESWRQWSVRLDDATERKLILLGHREPPAGYVGLN